MVSLLSSIRVDSCLFVVLFSFAIQAATFDEQRSAITSTIPTQPEAAITTLLKAGLAEGKPTQAIAETQRWLQRNVPEDAALLYHAARAAELSADWKTAISLYRQYLLRADLTSKMADDAVYAVYTLYFDRLVERGRTGDAWGAYEFSRTEGDRLLVCPRARQFDEFFLHHVTRYNQRGMGLARRLLACLEVGLPDDLLAARYEKYFLWLLAQIDTPVAYTGHNSMKLTDELATIVEKITAAMNFDEELKLRLDWALSVKRYNAAKLAGAEAKPPIAQATALLAAHPHYAKWVQDRWTGGDAKAHWQQEIEAKMAPVLAAIPKLTPLQRTELMRDWRADTILTAESVRAYVKAHPELMNSATGVLVLDKPWAELTPEEAMALAPQLVRNPSRTAALIRAKAAGGKEQDYAKIMAAYLGAESWRFPMHHDQRNAGWFRELRAFGGTPEQENEANKLKAAVGGGLDTVDLKPDAPSAERLAVFRKFWANYMAPQPAIASVHERLKKILAVTPEAIAGLLKDPRAEAQLLAREAISKRGIDVKNYRLWIAGLWSRYPGNQRNFEGLKAREPEKAKPHELEPALRVAVAQGIKARKMDAWQLVAWVNLQYPEDNAEQLKLVQELVASSVWRTLPGEIRQVVRQHFKEHAVEPAHRAVHDAVNPALVCKDLLAIPQTSDLSTATAALQQAIDGVRQAPNRIALEGLDNLATVSDAVFTNPKLLNLLFEVADELRGQGLGHPVGKRLRLWLFENPDPVLLHRAAMPLWQSAIGIPGRYANHPERAHEFAALSTLTHELLVDQPSAAKVLAQTGLRIFGKQRSDRDYDGGRDLPPLKTLIGKASLQMGLVSIPVGRNDPAYPIYKSQAEWLTGNEESAWTMIEENWDALLPVHRELSMAHLLWVLQRTLYSREEARQEAFINALLLWIAEPGSPWSLEQKIDIEIAYGDMAIQLGQLENAHKLFVRTQQNADYEHSVARHKATLRRVRVERLAKRYDAALRTLQELDMARIPTMWAPSRYARAEVYFAMDEFDDASDDVEAILARDSSHAEAKIMQGKLQLARQKLMEASELDLGSADAQTTLVPGEKLKVTLDDPTLAVSGVGTEIEVVVWAGSGDRERFLLRQFGDNKTKFRGEVATGLGAPVPDDRTLQLIGDDEIYYAYSERFRKKMNDMSERRGGPITVKSDAILMASARKLLSEAEQRIADQKRLNEALAKRHMSKLELSKTAGGDKLAALKAEIAEAERARLAQERIKPGRDINVRVIDPDRSRTAGIDELTVSVATSSGDSIAEVTLKETGPYSGQFEAAIPTKGAPAMAFAAHTEPGRNPNSVISPTRGAPAWKPVAGENPVFTIDLNDNLALGEMTISAREPGGKLKQFFVETGLNAHNTETVVGYPANPAAVEKPWSPSVRIMNATGTHASHQVASLYDIGRHDAHFREGWQTQKLMQGVAENVAGPSGALAAAISAKVAWKHNSHHGPALVIYRFRGYFYEKAEVTRRFRLELGDYTIPTTMRNADKFQHPAQFMLAVDGRPITSAQEPEKLEGEAALKAGLHRFEIWATGWNTSIGFGRSIKLLANVGRGDALADCPDAFFDPAKIPPGIISEQRNGRAAITANADGTEFKVTFAPGSRTRLLRLRVRAHEGPVPALNSVRLTDAQAKQVLPVATDYAALNRNKTLEILTGDKVTVRYLDDRFVSEDKEKHERFLNVGFSNARVGFERYYQVWSRYGPVDRYDKQLRFVEDDPFLLTVRDADMDSSDGRDTLEVTLASKTGGAQTFQALESEEYPGTFELSVTAVSGVPAKAQAGEAQIKVGEGEALTAIYRDAENIRPSVPIDRHARVRRAVYKAPALFVSHAVVKPLDYSRFDHSEGARRDRRPPEPAHVPASYGGDLGIATAAGLGDADLQARSGTGTALPRWAVSDTVAPAANPPAGGAAALLGRMFEFAIEVPHLALRGSSQIEVFVQTDAGRDQGDLLGDLGDESGAPAFDISAPGTIKLAAGVGGGPQWRRVAQNPIYWGEERDRNVPYEQGATFRASVPLIPGVLPEHGVLSDDEILRLDELGMWQAPRGLVVQPGETVHVGFRYRDETGAQQWLTGSATVTTHAVLEVMEEDYQEPKTSGFVGQSLYLRVVDLGGDVSDESDTVRVLMQAKSGAKHKVELLEAGEHSGVFQARIALIYAQKTDADTETNALPYDARRDGFPAIYSDTVATRYTDALGQKTETQFVTINKGADGGIAPFSKVYDDPAIGMDTQFLLAESYLEMAARHRKLGEAEQAAAEYAQAKSMLEKAMEMFRDPETRAHAEFLLATLTQEEADTTADKELQQDRYRAALSRYMRVTRSYTDSIYASQAQYKIATVYEKMDEPEIAAQEYVKLAYKYPDSEYLALSMIRLGGHFKKKAGAYDAQGRSLREKTDDEDAQAQAEVMQRLAVKEYLKSAGIYARMQARFPDHELAGKSGLQAGKVFMRAADMRAAVAALKQVIGNESYDGPDVRAQAMYWAGKAMESIVAATERPSPDDAMAAYSHYKRLTYDFPESKWAAYARGQLEQERFLSIEDALDAGER